MLRNGGRYAKKWVLTDWDMTHQWSKSWAPIRGSVMILIWLTMAPQDLREASTPVVWVGVLYRHINAKRRLKFPRRKGPERGWSKWHPLHFPRPSLPLPSHGEIVVCHEKNRRNVRSLKEKGMTMKVWVSRKKSIGNRKYKDLTWR